MTFKRIRVTVPAVIIDFNCCSLLTSALVRLQAIVAFSGFQHGYFTEMDALWLLHLYLFIVI
jgi:hypothetical protein